MNHTYKWSYKQVKKKAEIRYILLIDFLERFCWN